MENKKMVLSKNITPTTKRIIVICLTVFGVAAIAGACFGAITFQEAALVALPAMTSISAMADGGK